MDRLGIKLESLLTNDRFVRGVARGLLTDGATVDDVVQDTWWAAITRRPDSARPLLPWLATVARNFARKARRGEARRHNREIGAAIREALPATASLVERESTRRMIVDAVLELPEPLKSTVVLRYFDRMPPRAIAQLTGEPAKTVRSRLARALSILRVKLAPLDPKARASWGAILMAIAQGPRPATIGAATAGKVAILGALAMTTSTKIATLLAVVLIVAGGLLLIPNYLSSGQKDGAPVRSDPVSATASPRASRPELATLIRPRPYSESEPTPDEPSVRATPGSEVRDSNSLRERAASDGAAFEGWVLVDSAIPISWIAVECSLGSDHPAYAGRTRCDVNGSFRFQEPKNADPLVTEPSTLRVIVGAIGVDSPLADVAGIVLRRGETTRDPRLDPLDLRGKLRLVKVTVVDGASHPVPGAYVFAEPRAGTHSEFGICTDKDGVASLLATSAAVDLRVESDGFGTTRVHGVSGDTRVVLRNRPRISFRLQGELPSLPQGVTAWVAFVRLPSENAEGHPDKSPLMRRLVDPRARLQSEQVQERDLMGRRVELALNDDWSGEVAMPESGTFQVSLMLERGPEGGRKWRAVGFQTPLRIRVEDRDGLQPFSCAGPANAAFEKTLEELKR